MSSVWFITGSSRGLGLSITEAVLKSGASVIATARNPNTLNHLVEKYGDKILPVSLDVTNNEDVLKAVKLGHEKFGRIDFVINNAGYADLEAVEDVSIESFKAQVDTNFLGVVYVTKAVLPILRNQKSGHIFQISSVGGRIGGTPGLSAYQSAKFAVWGFSNVLSREVAPLGIKVTVMEPGGMKTDWAGSSMKIPKVSEAYEPTVGFWSNLMQTMKDDFPSHPDKVAEIVLKLSEEKEPPLRILVGSDAVQLAAATAEKERQSDERWKELSLASHE